LAKALALPKPLTAFSTHLTSNLIMLDTAWPDRSADGSHALCTPAAAAAVSKMLMPTGSRFKPSEAFLLQNHTGQHPGLCALDKHGEYRQSALFVTVGYYGTSWSLDEQGSMMTVTLVVNCCVT
jgi:hypothetical protein